MADPDEPTPILDEVEALFFPDGGGRCRSCNAGLMRPAGHEGVCYEYPDTWPCDTCRAFPCECIITGSFYLGEPIIDRAAHLRGGDGYPHVVWWCTCGGMRLGDWGITRLPHTVDCRWHPAFLRVRRHLAPAGVRFECTEMAYYGERLYR